MDFGALPLIRQKVAINIRLEFDVDDYTEDFDSLNRVLSLIEGKLRRGTEQDSYMVEDMKEYILNDLRLMLNEAV